MPVRAQPKGLGVLRQCRGSCRQPGSCRLKRHNCDCCLETASDLPRRLPRVLPSHTPAHTRLSLSACQQVMLDEIKGGTTQTARRGTVPPWTGSLWARTPAGPAPTRLPSAAAVPPPRRRTPRRRRPRRRQQQRRRARRGDAGRAETPARLACTLGFVFHNTPCALPLSSSHGMYPRSFIPGRSGSPPNEPSPIACPAARAATPLPASSAASVP